jgi:multisubunit Na+/H+ antiporter MnhB subunit
MKLKTIYLILCVLGALLPLSIFVLWVIENGLDLPLFVQELFSTKIGGFFGMDVIVSATVLFILIFSEGKRLKMTKLWLPVIATLGVGVSLGLPLYLYMRQSLIDG